MHSHRFARVAAAAGAILATGALVVAPAVATTAHASAKATKISCRGNDRLCNAVVSLAGGASNKKLQIELPGTSLLLTDVVAKPSWIHGAYALSGGTYSLGGSLYTVTLNAVQSIPKGATLTLRFQDPAQAFACKASNRAISYETIAKLGSKQAKGAFSCQQANAVTDTWALRFKARESVEAFSVDDVKYACKLVPTLPQNTRCDGGGTRVKFSAPTGR
jgi:hypothetical protein